MSARTGRRGVVGNDCGGGGGGVGMWFVGSVGVGTRNIVWRM